MKQTKENSLLNLKKGDTVKGFPGSLLHMCNCGWPRCFAVFEFCCAPELLDEVQLAVVLWVEVANVPTAFNELLEL